MAKRSWRLGGRRHLATGAPIGVAGLVLTLAACSVTATPATTTGMSAGAASFEPTQSPLTVQSTTAPSPTASGASLPGFVEVEPCDTVSGTGLTCLGRDEGTVVSKARSGFTMAIVMNVTNPGSSPSPVISLLVYELDAGPLPFGSPDCPSCRSTASHPVLGMEWPALEAGETRAISVDVSITAPAGTAIWFASLYAAPLAAVEAAATSGGVEPGQENWKVATTLAP